MIEINDITVKFGGVFALNNVHVKLDASVVGIIGPNGAGKTTFLNVMSGFVIPNSGSIKAFGTSLLSLAPHARAKWGLRRSFQKEQVVDDLTTAENIRVVIDPLGLSRAEAKRAEEAALDYVGLRELANEPASQLDAFNRRMVEIGRCVAGKPKLVMLDEPGAGFSQHEVEKLRDLILGIKAETGAMTLLIDHDVDLIQATCENTMVLDFGKLVIAGETGEVLRDDRVRAVYLGMEEA